VYAITPHDSSTAPSVFALMTTFGGALKRLGKTRDAVVDPTAFTAKISTASPELSVLLNVAVSTDGATVCVETTVPLARLYRTVYPVTAEPPLAAAAVQDTLV
jgi:hypothetical protein